MQRRVVPGGPAAAEERVKAAQRKRRDDALARQVSPYRSATLQRRARIA